MHNYNINNELNTEEIKNNALYGLVFIVSGSAVKTVWLSLG